MSNISKPVTAPTSLPELAKSIHGVIEDKSRWTKFKRMYKNDRVAFVYDAMPTLAKTITDYQLDILGTFDDGITRVAVRGPHGLGKTCLASVLVHHTILTAEGDCKVPTTASAWRQLEKFLWPEIKKSVKLLSWPVIGRPSYDTNGELFTQNIRLEDGTVEAFATASDDPATLEGAHATTIMYVFDEAKIIPVPTWDAVEGAFSNEGLSTTDKAMAFAISTPGNPVGRFYDIHMHKPGYEDWYTKHVTLDMAIQAGRISGKWAAQRAKQWGVDSSIYLNRVLGEFADSSEDGIIPLSWVRAANERWKQWDLSGRPSTRGPRTMGVDPARMGEAQTVLAVRDGLALSAMHITSKTTTTQNAKAIQTFYNNDKRAIHIEMDGGLGASIYDILREAGVRVTPITVAAKTWKRDKTGKIGFVNVRTAMWYNMRELLDPINGSGIMLPPIERLTTELITPIYTPVRADGDIDIIALEAKDSIIDRLGASTDYADAVCLAFWGGSSGGGVLV